MIEEKKTSSSPQDGVVLPDIPTIKSIEAIRVRFFGL